METILLALSPILVPIVTNFVKRLRTFNSLRGGFRSIALRFTVVLLSFGAVVGSSVLGNAEVDATSIQVFVDSFLVFLASTGTYFIAKKTAGVN